MPDPIAEPLASPSGLLFTENGIPYYFASNLLCLLRLSHEQLVFLRKMAAGDAPLACNAMREQGKIAGDSSEIGSLCSVLLYADSCAQRSLSIPISAMPRIRVKAAGITPTMACNMSCDYCYLNGPFAPVPAAPRAMDPAMARKAVDWIIAQAEGDEELSVSFFGGEPLLAPNVVAQTLRYGHELASRAGVRVKWSMTTNGLLLTEELSDELIEHGVNLRMSLDGPSIVHDAHRFRAGGGGTHSAVERALEYAIRRGPEQVTICAVVTDATVEHWDETVAYLRRYPSTKELVFCYDGTPHSPKLETRAFVIREIVGEPNAYSDFRLMTVTEKLEMLRRRQPVHYGCPAKAGISTVYIDPGGGIYPCYNLFGRSEYELGTVCSGDFTDHAQNVRYGFLAVDVANDGSEPCRRCWARWICGGACPARNINLGGRHLPGTPDMCLGRLKHYELMLRAFANRERERLLSPAEFCEREIR